MFDSESCRNVYYCEQILNGQRWCLWVSKLQTHLVRRMLQFCARRPSMTDNSLTFLEVTASSSVSFCRKTNGVKVSINITLKWRGKKLWETRLKLILHLRFWCKSVFDCPLSWCKKKKRLKHFAVWFWTS